MHVNTFETPCSCLAILSPLNWSAILSPLTKEEGDVEPGTGTGTGTENQGDRETRSRDGLRCKRLNGNANSVTIVNLTTGVVVAVGAGPRSVAIDSANIAYITNQADGTISVLNLATAKVTGTIALSGARPAAIRLLVGTPYAIVTDPATADDGKVLVVHLTTGVVTSF